MARTRIKICGMTQAKQASFAISAGVDAIGMILYADSPRCIDIDTARAIRQAVPALVSLVGVFVNAEKSLIQSYAQQIKLDCIQLHGNETNEFIDSLELDKPVIKAIRARSAEFVQAEVTSYPSASALLLDPYVKGQKGGTGVRLNAECWPEYVDKPMILAGGLSPTNLSEALTQTQAYAVDLNSGLEDFPGHKSELKIQQAVTAVQKFDIGESKS